jgi:hypothetical protein
MIRTYAELPDVIKAFYSTWIKDDKEKIEEVNLRIPALGNKSVLEVINEENGIEKVVIFIKRLSGKLGIPYSITLNEVTHQYELVKVPEGSIINWDKYSPKK